MNITSEHKRISDLNAAGWRKELDDDIDRDFILHGVEHGCIIVDKVNVDKCAETNSHSSCFTDHKMKSFLPILFMQSKKIFKSPNVKFVCCDAPLHIHTSKNYDTLQIIDIVIYNILY